MSHHKGRNPGNPAEQQQSPQDPAEEALKRYHKGVIEQYWDVLAAMAWHGHQLAGRGFVLISGLLPDPEEGSSMLLKPEYVPMSPDNPHKPPYVVPPLFSHYNPDTEFIVGVEQTNGLRAAYHMLPEDGKLTPREAAQVVDLPL